MSENSAEPASYVIRTFRPGDEDAVYHVCLMTGDAGQDATGLYSDPKALGHIYVGPYMRLEPELAFVLLDDLGVCGYALGALDSGDFYDCYLNRWLPEIRATIPEPSGNPSSWTATQRLHHEYYHPDIFFPPAFLEFRSHLHIDLLPRAQGRGNGTRMMERLLSRLVALGSRGVHLSMAATNGRAERFYRKLGFAELARRGEGQAQTLYLGKKLAPN